VLRSPCDDLDVTFLKWREASWKLLTYGTLTAFGVASCAGEPWLRDTSLLWAGWPYAQTHSASLRFWYAAEFGLYAYGLVDLLVWEASRGDYYAMILHHVATLALLGGSFAYGCVWREPWVWDVLCCCASAGLWKDWHRASVCLCMRDVLAC
jgi:hypothetical protein